MSIAKALSITVFSQLLHVKHYFLQQAENCENTTGFARGCLENTVNTVVFDVNGKKWRQQAFRGTKAVGKNVLSS